MRTAIAGLVAVAVAWPGAAWAEEPQGERPTGTAWLVAGSLVTGAGVVNLVGAPLCVATLPQAQRTPCAATSVAFGLVGVGVGIPLLVVGAGKRAMWLEQVKLSPTREGAVVGWGGHW